MINSGVISCGVIVDYLFYAEVCSVTSDLLRVFARNICCILQNAFPDVLRKSYSFYFSFH